MRRRVLVTRPQPGAEATARALRTAGFEPVILSLSEIQALDVPEMDLRDFDAVAATSANALLHAPEALLDQVTGLPLFAVGESTAAAASDAGFVIVLSGPGDAAGLTDAILAQLPGGSRLLYLCGRVRRPELEARLSAAGIATVAVETYDTRGATDVAERLGQAAAGGPLHAVMLHSAGAAEALARLPGAAPAGALHACISARTAAALRGVEPHLIIVAVEPTETAMIDALAAAA